MRTLYVDINNEPVQNTDEIICVSCNETLLNDFFYELGCSILSMSGINVPKAQLISGFNLPENADAYAKIIKQWEELKTILFGSNVEGVFKVYLPKEYMSWLGNHCNQDYRAICRNNNYDCTKELTLSIDVKEFYIEYINDDFVWTLIKSIYKKHYIKQIVFNDNIVTTNSQIIKNISTKMGLAFIPYEIWIKEQEKLKEKINKFFPYNYTPLIVISEKDMNAGGYRVIVKELLDTNKIIISGYYDMLYIDHSCLYLKNRNDNAWTVITPYGKTKSLKKCFRDIEILPYNNVLNKFHNCRIISNKNDRYLINSRKDNMNRWFLYTVSDNHSVDIISTKKNYAPEWLDYNIIRFNNKKNDSYYHTESKRWYYDVFKSFAIKIVDIDLRCEVFSLITGEHLLKDATIMYHPGNQYTNPYEEGAIITVSDDGQLGSVLDSKTNRIIVFNHNGDTLYLESSDYLVREDYAPDHILFSKDQILIRQGHQLISKNIKGTINWTVKKDLHENIIKILSSPQYDNIPCLCYNNDVIDSSYSFCMIHNGIITSLLEDPYNMQNIFCNEKKLDSSTYNKVKSYSDIRPREIRRVHFFTKKHFQLLLKRDFDFAQEFNELFTMDSRGVTRLTSSSIVYKDDNCIAIRDDDLSCFSIDGELITKHDINRDQDLNILK